MIIQDNLKTNKMIFFIFWVGLLRGALEVIWIFAINHRMRELFLLSRQPSWYIFESGPFILANILAAFLRWAMYSLVFCLLLKFFKIKINFSKVLKFFSITLGLYVLTILLNFIHCFFNLNMFQFHITPLYSYSMGIGQVLSSCLLIWFIYNLGSYFGLDKLASLLSAIFVLGSERFFFFFAAWVYFRLPLINLLPYKRIFYLANHLDSLVSVLLTFLFLWIGYRIDAQRKTNI